MKEHKIKILKKSNEEIEDFFDLLSINEQNDFNYIFRGQANSEWEIESSYRRLFEKENSLKSDIYTNFKNLIKDIKNNHKLNKTNLEIISEMQHYGLKTCLIDFTSDIYNALWFALNDEKGIDKDLTIFTFKIKNKSLIKNDLSFNDDANEKKYFYFCPINSTRGIAQKSYFVIDSEELEDNENIEKWIIAKELKEDIKKIIENRNVNSISIFPDLKGLYLEEFKNNLIKSKIIPNEKLKKLNNL